MQWDLRGEHEVGEGPEMALAANCSKGAGFVHPAARVDKESAKDAPAAPISCVQGTCSEVWDHIEHG